MGKNKEINLNDLRGNSVVSQSNIVFGKRVFGGYNVKQVSDYIQGLKESLRDAENSFKEKLDENSEMMLMLEKERDKNNALYLESEENNKKLNAQVNQLILDNKTLVNQLTNLNTKSLDNEKLKKELLEYQENHVEQEKLKSEFEELKQTLEELNEQVEEYSKNENPSDEIKSYGNIIEENKMIKEKYNEVVFERSMHLAEKESLTDQNLKLTYSLKESREKVKELRELIVKTKLNNRKIVTEFEARAYECAQNHQKNMDEITENIKNNLNILHFENENIANLINSPFEKIDSDISDETIELVER
jgi:chromosome segregation ATPase